MRVDVIETRARVPERIVTQPGPERGTRWFVVRWFGVRSFAIRAHPEPPNPRTTVDQRPRTTVSQRQRPDGESGEHAGACAEGPAAHSPRLTRLICIARPPRTGTGVSA